MDRRKWNEALQAMGATLKQSWAEVTNVTIYTQAKAIVRMYEDAYPKVKAESDLGACMEVELQAQDDLENASSQLEAAILVQEAAKDKDAVADRALTIAIQKVHEARMLLNKLSE